MNKQDYKLDKITAMVKNIMDQIQISNFSPEKVYSPKSQDPATVVPDNKKSMSLEGGNYTKNGGMLTLKHDIRPPKFYRLFIKT